MSLYQSSPIRVALVRPVPASFAQALAEAAPAEPIQVTLAQQQHEHYSRLVQSQVERLIEVPVDESCPDCCFIEDTAIVVGSTVIMTRIGAESRRHEAAPVLDAFKQLVAAGLPLRIATLKEPASLDGGDVLAMGGTLFVGLSRRTNLAAIEQLRAIVEIPVVGVPVGGALHLKSLLSAIDERTLLVADHPAGRAMGEQILAALPAGARMLVVPDRASANVVRLGRTLLLQAGFPRSEAILGDACRLLGLTPLPVCMSELIKADGALTCCSLLIP